MQTLYALVLAMIAAPSPAHAAADVAPFPEVQEQCVQVGAVTIGKQGRWTRCAVTKARWVATMDLLDQYQVHYCLSKHEPGCDNRAFLLFGNRAYTPEARLLLQHIEAGTTEYEDPLVIKTAYGRMLALTAVSQDGRKKTSYYLWRDRRWLPVEAKGWARQLTAQLPRGLRTRPEPLWPDIDLMAVHAPLYRAEGEAAGEIAQVELAVKNQRFVVKRVTVAPQPEETDAPALQALTRAGQ